MTSGNNDVALSDMRVVIEPTEDKAAHSSIQSQPTPAAVVVAADSSEHCVTPQPSPLSADAFVQSAEELPRNMLLPWRWCWRLRRHKHYKQMELVIYVTGVAILLTLFLLTDVAVYASLEVAMILLAIIPWCVIMSHLDRHQFIEGLRSFDALWIVGTYTCNLPIGVLIWSYRDYNEHLAVYDVVMNSILLIAVFSCLLLALLSLDYSIYVSRKAQVVLIAGTGAIVSGVVLSQLFGPPPADDVFLCFFPADNSAASMSTKEKEWSEVSERVWTHSRCLSLLGLKASCLLMPSLYLVRITVKMIWSRMHRRPIPAAVLSAAITITHYRNSTCEGTRMHKPTSDVELATVDGGGVNSQPPIGTTQSSTGFDAMPYYSLSVVHYPRLCHVDSPVIFVPIHRSRRNGTVTPLVAQSPPLSAPSSPSLPSADELARPHSPSASPHIIAEQQLNSMHTDCSKLKAQHGTERMVSPAANAVNHDAKGNHTADASPADVTVAGAVTPLPLLLTVPASVSPSSRSRSAAPSSPAPSQADASASCEANSAALDPSKSTDIVSPSRNLADLFNALTPFTPLLQSSSLRRVVFFLARHKLLLPYYTLLTAAHLFCCLIAHVDALASGDALSNGCIIVPAVILYLLLLVAFTLPLLVLVDRTLLRFLLRTFDCWYLTGLLLLHCIIGAVSLSFRAHTLTIVLSVLSTASITVAALLSDTLQGLPCVAANSHRRSLTVQTAMKAGALAVSTISDAATTVAEATPAAAAATVQPSSVLFPLRCLFLFACTANFLRILLMNFFTPTGLFPAKRISLLYTINTHDAAIGSIATIIIWCIRFIATSLWKPNRLLMLRSQLTAVRRETLNVAN